MFSFLTHKMKKMNEMKLYIVSNVRRLHMKLLFLH